MSQSTDTGSFISSRQVLDFLKSKNIQAAVLAQVEDLDLDENGLREFSEQDYVSFGFKPAQAKLLHRHGQALLSQSRDLVQDDSQMRPRRFRHSVGEGPEALFYQYGGILGVEECGASLLDRTMEFKELAWFSEEAFMRKLVKLILACINARQNATIYFGVSDDKSDGRSKHGEVTGVSITAESVSRVHEALDTHLLGGNPCQFSEEAMADGVHTMVKRCLGVSVVRVKGAPSNKVVIEVDVEPTSEACGEKAAYVKAKKGARVAYVRNGTQSVEVLPQKWDAFLQGVRAAAKRRKKEELERSRPAGSKVLESQLRQKLCRGQPKVDDALHQYILVTDAFASRDVRELFDWYGFVRWSYVLDMDHTGANYELASQADTDTLKHIPTSEIAEVIEKTKRDSEVIEGIEFGDKNPWIIGREEGQEVHDWVKQTKGVISDTIASLTSDVAQEHKKGIVVIFIVDGESALDKEFSCMVLDFLSHLKDENQIVCLSSQPSALDKLGSQLVGLIGEEAWQSMALCCDSWHYLASFMEGKTRKARGAGVNLKIPCSSGKSGIKFEVKLAEKFSNKNIDILFPNQWAANSVAADGEGASEQERLEAVIGALREFYRGADATWDLFHYSFCKTGDKPYPGLVERPRVWELVDDLRAFQELDQEVSVLRIFHYPDSGATTLAMHALWELRGEMRCVRVDGLAIMQSDERRGRLRGAANNLEMLRCWGEKDTKDQSRIKPVLILLDKSAQALPNQLRDELRNVLSRENRSSPHCKFIILACCQSRNTASSKDSDDTLRPTGCDKFLVLQQQLDDKEQPLFESKLKDLEKLPGEDSLDTLLAFVIMANNFDRKSPFVVQFVEKAIYGIEKYPRDANLLLYLSILKFFGSPNHTGLPTKHCKILVDGAGDKFRTISHSICSQANMLLIEKELRHELYNSPFLYLEVNHGVVAQLLIERLCKARPLSETVKELLRKKAFISEKFQERRVHDTLRYLLIRRGYRDEAAPEILDGEDAGDPEQQAPPPGLWADHVQERKEPFSKIVTSICSEESSNDAIKTLEEAHQGRKEQKWH